MTTRITPAPTLRLKPRNLPAPCRDPYCRGRRGHRRHRRPLPSWPQTDRLPRARRIWQRAPLDRACHHPARESSGRFVLLLSLRLHRCPGGKEVLCRVTRSSGRYDCSRRLGADRRFRTPEHHRWRPRARTTNAVGVAGCSVRHLRAVNPTRHSHPGCRHRVVVRGRPPRSASVSLGPYRRQASLSRAALCRRSYRRFGCRAARFRRAVF